MESASASSTFRFRDHQEPENDAASDSDISSVSGDDDDESEELESMTARGINRMCTELLEIKVASNEDFHRNIFSSYSTFVGILDEVKDMEKELMQLRIQVSTQQRLVKELTDGVCLKAFSVETIESIIEESESDELALPDELEAHINDVSDNLDLLLSENRIDEAIAIIELEEENLQRVQLESNNTLSDVLLSYNSAISERKAILTRQLILVAGNSGISAPELQKSLVGLCRLGHTRLATQFMLNYYHLRVATGIQKLQGSKSTLHLVYIKELSKFVFSMISQAARSFVLLYGETSPYALELIDWVQEEIEVFVISFTKCVKTISEISGGLSTAVEAVKLALLYSSLLENQRLLLQPHLIKQFHPCMEDVLVKHIEHFKKVISIFTATDAWILGRYLISGMSDESYSSMVVGQKPDYCLLTNSGRKFVTLLQATTEDVAPLVALQMEGTILRGLMNLFTEYIAITEIAINSGTDVSQNNNSTIIMAESMSQQVSILVNVSTLEHFVYSIIMSIFSGIKCTNSELTENQLVGIQQQEVESSRLFIQEASGCLRTHFCQQFIYRVFSQKSRYSLTPEISIDSTNDPCEDHTMMPSAAFQVLFLELRDLDKLAEEDFFEADWLMELKRELIEAIFAWISNNKEIWETNEENLTSSRPDVLNQFVLDVYFLVKITSYGEYSVENPSVSLDLMKSALVSAGMDPGRDINNFEWAEKAAAEAIPKLLEIKETKSLSNDVNANVSVEKPLESHVKHGSEAAQDDGNPSTDSLPLEEDKVAMDASEEAVDTGKEISNAELNDLGCSSDFFKDKGWSTDGSQTQLSEIFWDVEDVESESEASKKYPSTEKTSSADQLLSLDIGKASERRFLGKEEATVRNDEIRSAKGKVEDGAGTG